MSDDPLEPATDDAPREDEQVPWTYVQPDRPAQARRRRDWQFARTLLLVIGLHAGVMYGAMRAVWHASRPDIAVQASASGGFAEDADQRAAEVAENPLVKPAPESPMPPAACNPAALSANQALADASAEVPSPMPPALALMNPATNEQETPAEWVGMANRMPPAAPHPPARPMRNAAAMAAASSTVAPVAELTARANPEADGASARSTPAAGQQGSGSTQAVPSAANPPLIYPPEALRKKWEGTVLLQLVVDSDGAVGQITLLASSGHSILDRAAIDQVKKKRFEPATENGRACACQIDLPVRFVIQQ